MIAALAQTNISWENKVLNYKKAEIMIKNAAAQGAEIVFFPEMSFTGFSMNLDNTGEYGRETPDQMAEYSKKYGIFIGFGRVCLRDGKGENHYTIMAPDRESILDYNKIHPFSFGKENKYFNPGSSIVTCKAAGIGITTFICYDLRFPEIFQNVPDHIELVVVAANWPESRREHWKVLLRARAVENQVFVAGVNCTGKTGGIAYSGDSCFISPNGDLLESLEYEEGLLFCEIGKQVKKQRENFPFRQDRRRSLYGKWYHGNR